MELGSGEIVLILLVALLIYGGKLPQVALALGRSVREFRRAMQDTRDLVRTHVEVEGADPGLRGVTRMRPEDLPEDEPLPEGWATEDVSGEPPVADEDSAEPGSDGEGIEGAEETGEAFDEAEERP